jgi:hypothetical protein
MGVKVTTHQATFRTTLEVDDLRFWGNASGASILLMLGNSDTAWRRFGIVFGEDIENSNWGWCLETSLHHRFFDDAATATTTASASSESNAVYAVNEGLGTGSTGTNAAEQRCNRPQRLQLRLNRRP